MDFLKAWKRNAAQPSVETKSPAVSHRPAEGSEGAEGAEGLRELGARTSRVFPRPKMLKTKGSSLQLIQLTSSHLACQSDDAPPAMKIVPMVL